MEGKKVESCAPLHFNLFYKLHLECRALLLLFDRPSEHLMRTEEEAKYDLDERILDLYDGGLSIKAISDKLDTTSEYILSVLKNVSTESV